MKRLLLIVLLMVGVGCASSRPQTCCAKLNESQIVAQINEMMLDSAKTWTADDLDGFMQAFHNSPDLVFAIPTGITKGWQPLKERYAKSIAKSDLWFTDIQTTVITADTALVFARFNNEMKEDKSYSTGLTTLLVKKIDGSWVIVHDHSSGLPADTPRAARPASAQ